MAGNNSIPYRLLKNINPMAQNNLHTEAKKVLKQSLKNILSNCKVSKGLISFDEKNDKEIDKYINEAEKHKKTWLGYRELYGILYRQVSHYLNEHIKERRWETSDDLKNIITDKGIENVSDRIIAYLESIPRKYSIYFELPSVKGIGVKEVNLTDNISLIEKVDESDFPEIKIPGFGLGGRGLLGSYRNYSLNKGQLYVHIQTQGYADGTLESTAVKKAYSKFKQFILLAKTKGLLVERERGIATLGDFYGYTTKEDSPIYVVYDKEPDTEKYPITLPKIVSEYISKMRINEDILKPDEYELIVEKFEDKNALTPNDKAKILKDRLQYPIKLLKTTDTDADAEPIKTAIEWAFDSLTNDNETVAFIQACIGLEAILGDEEEEPQKSLQNKFADRCAYLLGKNFSERKNIKESFVKLYNIRSKLNHGRKAKLDREQLHFLRFSQSILNRIIWKEISYIEDIGTTTS